MTELTLEDFLLDTLVGLAGHHGEQYIRRGNQVQTLDGGISIQFRNLEFGERSPGNFVMLATVQISAPASGIADLYDSIVEGGPNRDIPWQHALMEIFHLLQFVKKAITGIDKPDTQLALANADGQRSFMAYFYGPIVRADDNQTRADIEKKIANDWIYKKVFAGVPAAFTGYKPYWVKVNHIKAGENNIPECRLDEMEWPEVQSQIATFQWPLSDGLMGYKQFFIFMPAGQRRNM